MTGWNGQSDDLAFQLMTWDEIDAMRTAGIDFGSHTRTHPALDQLDENMLMDELCGSREELERSMGESVSLLAYPYELHTPAVHRIAEKCGYLAACGSPRHAEGLYNIWRAEMGGADTLESFKYKLSPAWRRRMVLKYRLRPVRNLVRRVTGR